MDHFEEIGEFISICLAFFTPITKKKRKSSEDIHEFMLAELDFLISAIKHVNNIFTCQFHLIIQFITEFFIKVKLREL